MKFRKATATDANLIYQWANDPGARSNSYSNKPIEYEDHLKWFNNKITDPNCTIYIFLNENYAEIGMVRIEVSSLAEKDSTISIIIDAQHRGKGYAQQMIREASIDFTDKTSCSITAYVFATNMASLKSFQQAGYKVIERLVIKEVDSYLLKFMR
jgi:RimJ/RimL family protein N-acetyltransferase